MPLLNREALNGMKSQKLKVVRVTVREWGAGLEAYIGEMTADERDDRLEAPWLRRKEKLGRDDNVGFRAFAVAACLCDAERNWIAAGEEAIVGMAEQIGDLSAVPVSRLFSHACKLNGLTEADVEELEKNLPATASDSGSGGSLETPDAPAPANTSSA